MADTKVSDLTPITVADNNDELYIVDTSAGASKKITFGNLLSGIDTRVTNLNTIVNDFTTIVLDLSTTVENANINIAPVTSDVLEISGAVHVLTDEVNDNTAAFAAGLNSSIVISSSTFTFSAGQLISVTQ